VTGCAVQECACGRASKAGGGQEGDSGNTHMQQCCMPRRLLSCHPKPGCTQQRYGRQAGMFI
jgi:hypothetical protein